MSDLHTFILALALFVGVGLLARYIRTRRHSFLADSATSSYRLKPHFFSQSEFAFFQTLSSTLPADQFRIFPKVRLGDYIEPTGSGRARYGNWQRIKSRHVDFLVWDTHRGRPVLAIELDGHSHESTTVQATDAFKDQLFQTIGLPLHRVQVGSDFDSAVRTIFEQIKGD